MKIDGEERHVLCVKSNEPVNLPIGVYQTVKEKSTGVEITYTVKLSGLIKRSKDAEGNCYAWYTLSEYARTADGSLAAKEAAEQNAANIDYLSMMTGIDLPDGAEEDEEGADE
jgi:hypothetical protein